MQLWEKYQMYSGRSGANTMPSAKILFLIAAFSVLALFVACGGDSSDKPANQPVQALSDEEQIQETLNEVLIRWKHGDKAAAYDNEFDYLHDRMSFDDYVNTRELAARPDTVKELKVTDAQIFGKDSALVDVDVVFEGPTGKTTVLKDRYRLYWHRNQWIRPTLSNFKAQQEYARLRQDAESAAAAEAEELGDE